MELIELDAKKLASLKAKWLDLISPESHPVLGAEYQQLFERIGANGAVGPLRDCVDKAHFASVVENEESWAIVEMVQTRKGKAVWIKMMDIYMSPQIEASPDTEGNTQRRLNVFTACLSGIFKLTQGIKGVDTVKVYGRTEALVAFLRGMHDTLSAMNSLGTISGIEVSIEGRWLVFRAA